MRPSLSAILDWLRAGYPDGVPTTGYYPLLALLQRTLSEEELREIVRTLIIENPEGVSAADAEAVIAEVTDAPVSSDDLSAVAARLASVGWPLSDFGQDDADDDTAGDSPAGWGEAQDGAAVDPPSPSRTASDEDAGVDRVSMLEKIRQWLAAGFPDGVPPQDRLPLLALLERRLTDEEAEEIARDLLADARAGVGISTADAGEAITSVTHEEPTEEEIDRVSAHLAAKGWPLEG